MVRSESKAPAAGSVAETPPCGERRHARITVLASRDCPGLGSRGIGIANDHSRQLAPHTPLHIHSSTHWRLRVCAGVAARSELDLIFRNLGRVPLRRAV